MFFLAITAYFLLACFVGWLLLFPTAKDQLRQLMGTAQYKARARAVQYRNSGLIVRNRLRESGAQTGVLVGQSLRRYAREIAITAGVLAFPVLLAVGLGGKSMLSAFDVDYRDPNLRIAELLKGEQLVPPPALPPEVFATQEVLLLRPSIGNASRNWQLLRDEYAQRLLLVFKIMKEKHGYDLALLEGYRSPERQAMLAAQGPHVTSADAFQSYHQYGLAADVAFWLDGKLVISEKDPWAMKGYQLYGEVAESVGLTWGGRWKMMDFGHTEFRAPNLKIRATESGTT